MKSLHPPSLPWYVTSRQGKARKWLNPWRVFIISSQVPPQVTTSAGHRSVSWAIKFRASVWGKWSRQCLSATLKEWGVEFKSWGRISKDLMKLNQRGKGVNMAKENQKAKRETRRQEIFKVKKKGKNLGRREKQRNTTLKTERMRKTRTLKVGQRNWGGCGKR